MLKTISVLGAGSWGTALAILLAKNGNSVKLWGRNAEAIKQMAASHYNTPYLRNILLPENLLLTSDIENALADVNDILIAVPSHSFAATLELVKSFTSTIRLCWATKGLEPGTGRLLHEVAQQIFGAQLSLAVLSGPSFAHEVALDLPTAITLATTDQQFGIDLTAKLHNNNFRVYTCNDIIGVQLGGAIKNVLAIATGISDSLGYGANARSALITRGLAELVRLGLALGGNLATFMGLAGMGDLVLTCTDNQSRNRRFGIALGEGKTVAEAEKIIGQVIEGLRNTKEVLQLGFANNIDMPITQQVYNILYLQIPAQQAVLNLLSREPKSEY